jgi:autophagy-related protein 2
MNAELDWSNPFPPELVAPDMILAAIRMAVKKVEIVDHVRSSRWKTFLTRRIAKGEAGPMVQLKMEMNFVDREEPKLLPEDQLEATIKLDVEPLRLHIDQDTLLFMLRFLDSKPTRRDVSPMFFGLSYNCD